MNENVLKEEISMLESQIRTLQQENKRYRELGFKYLNEQNEKLQQRINKATEILKLCNSQCSKKSIRILQGKDE